MWGFSKKRFLITLGLSILIWLMSMVVQSLFRDNVNYGLFIFAKSCEVTGYPIARCIADYDKGSIYLTYSVNLFFWFWVLHFSWSWFDKRRN